MKYINKGEVSADWHDLMTRAENLIHAIGKDGNKQSAQLKDQLSDLVEKGASSLRSNKERAVVKTHDAIHLGLHYAQQRPLQVIGAVGLLAASLLVIGLVSCRKNNDSGQTRSIKKAVR